MNIKSGKEIPAIDLNIENYDHFGFYTEGIYGKIAKMKHRTLKNEEVACIYDLNLERNGQELIEMFEMLKNAPNGLLKYYGQCSQFKSGVKITFYFFEFMLLSLKLSLSLKEVLNENQINCQRDFQFAFIVFETLLNTFAFLQKININIREFHPSNILFNDAKTQAKLNIFCLTQNIAHMQQGRVQCIVSDQEGSLYTAPEFLQAGRNERNKMNIDDIFKADAYSFGLMIMELVRSKKFDIKIGDLDQRLKQAIEEVERMRIPDDWKEKHRILVIMLKEFLKKDPKARMSFRDGFLKKVELHNPDKYKKYIQNLEDPDKTKNLISLEDFSEKHELIYHSNDKCFKKASTLFSKFCSKMLLILLVLLFAFNISSFILLMEFYQDLPFFEKFFENQEAVYISITTIIILDFIKSIIFLAVYISLFGSFFEKFRYYANFACFALLGILALIHFFFRMVFLLGNDNFILSFLEKIENTKDNFHSLYERLNAIYGFEIFLAAFVIIELPWCLQITIWNIEKLKAIKIKENEDVYELKNKKEQNYTYLKKK